jgi:hypothetical protein
MPLGRQCGFVVLGGRGPVLAHATEHVVADEFQTEQGREPKKRGGRSGSSAPAEIGDPATQPRAECHYRCQQLEAAQVASRNRDNDRGKAGGRRHVRPPPDGPMVRSRLIVRGCHRVPSRRSGAMQSLHTHVADLARPAGPIRDPTHGHRCPAEAFTFGRTLWIMCDTLSSRQVKIGKLP